MFEGAMKDQVTQEELVGLFGRVTTGKPGSPQSLYLG